MIKVLTECKFAKATNDSFKEKNFQSFHKSVNKNFPYLKCMGQAVPCGTAVRDSNGTENLASTQMTTEKLKKKNQ